MQCSAIKKNMHCVMKGHPCKVIETSTSKVRALLLLLPLFLLLALAASCGGAPLGLFVIAALGRLVVAIEKESAC